MQGGLDSTGKGPMSVLVSCSIALTAPGIYTCVDDPGRGIYT